MKIYIAGKITGLDNYKELFDKKEKELIEEGFRVVNPTVLPLGLEYDDYLWMNFAMIDVCDSVYFLNNWKDSEGAKAEQEYAERKGKLLIYEADDEK